MRVRNGSGAGDTVRHGRLSAAPAFRALFAGLTCWAQVSEEARARCVIPREMSRLVRSIQASPAGAARRWLLRGVAAASIVWFGTRVTSAEPGVAQSAARTNPGGESLKAASLEAAAAAVLRDTDAVPTHVPSSGELAPFSGLSLEDPSGHAFDAFFASLGRAARKQGKARIVFYGDSHTAPDLITGRLRSSLQAEFGDAGPGFVMPGKPFPHHHHTLVEYAPSKGLTGARINRSVREGKFGMFGAALKAKRAVTVHMRTRHYGKASGQASELELYYLKQPGGGRVQVSLDGRALGAVSTRSKVVGGGYQHYRVPDGLHEIVLRTSEGAVTLLGLTLERKQAGVVVDTLGIPGARAKFHLLWDEQLYAEQLKKRDPDLVVMAYGTNEAGDEDLSLSDYEQTVRKTVSRLRGLAPHASCLLLGPTDRPEKLEDGRWAPRAAVLSVNALQRKIAGELGCAFVDVQAAMGGPLSIIRLAEADPPYAARDFVHLTMRGYEALGDALYAALLRTYRAAGAGGAAGTAGE
jgi:lysophospholipase L1-like esterase